MNHPFIQCVHALYTPAQPDVGLECPSKAHMLRLSPRIGSGEALKLQGLLGSLAVAVNEELYVKDVSTHHVESTRCCCHCSWGTRHTTSASL